MGLASLKKEGWFDKGNEDFDLPLSQDQIKQIKSGKEVVVEKNGETYLVYIRQNANRNELTKSDVVIRLLPVTVRHAGS